MNKTKRKSSDYHNNNNKNNNNSKTTKITYFKAHTANDNNEILCTKYFIVSNWKNCKKIVAFVFCPIKFKLQPRMDDSLNIKKKKILCSTKRMQTNIIVYKIKHFFTLTIYNFHFQFHYFFTIKITNYPELYAVIKIMT